MTRDCPLFLCPSVKNNLTKQKYKNRLPSNHQVKQTKNFRKREQRNMEKKLLKKFKKLGFLRAQLNKRQQTLSGGGGRGVKIVEM